MEVATRPNVVKHIFNDISVEANPTQTKVLRRVGLDRTIIDIFWRPSTIIVDPRNTKDINIDWDSEFLMSIYNGKLEIMITWWSSGSELYHGQCFR